MYSSPAIIVREMVGTIGHGTIVRDVCDACGKRATELRGHGPICICCGGGPLAPDRGGRHLAGTRESDIREAMNRHLLLSGQAVPYSCEDVDVEP